MLDSLSFVPQEFCIFQNCGPGNFNSFWNERLGIFFKKNLNEALGASRQSLCPVIVLFRSWNFAGVQSNNALGTFPCLLITFPPFFFLSRKIIKDEKTE